MKIAIIGCGFSAISLLLELVKETSGTTFYVIEKENEFGQGVAFGTPYPWHLLNVRAGKMGASSDDPEGFYKWLQTHEQVWRHADPLFQHLVIDKEAFLPRKLYALYLASLLDKLNSIEFIRGAVTDLNQNEDGQLELTLAGQRNFLASERTRFAAERTISAWIGTALASVGGGYAIVRLLSYDNATHRLMAHIVGEVLIIWGIVILTLSLMDYRTTVKKLVHSVNKTNELWISVTISVFVILSIFLFLVTL